MKLNISPPREQPKQCHDWRDGETKRRVFVMKRAISPSWLPLLEFDVRLTTSAILKRFYLFYGRRHSLVFWNCEIVFLKSTTERGGASKDDFSAENTSGSENSYFKIHASCSSSFTYSFSETRSGRNKPPIMTF